MKDSKNQWRDIKTTDDIPFDELESLFESSFQEITPKKNQKKALNTPLFDANSEVENKDFKQKPSDAPDLINKSDSPKKNRAHSTLGDQYQEEVQKIQQAYGGLEDIRRSLGLSKRRMALLLMVDPSAWTRWVKNGGQAPAHIWRALQWYMILQTKHPEMSASLWLNTLVQPQIPRQEIENIKSEVLEASQKRNRDNQRQSAVSLDTIALQTQKLKRAQKVLFALVGLHLLLAGVWALFLS